ncbi:MAG: hypothetical protein KGL35_10655 [Bradyrhizobium sp.]|nr:hypothetical protein [Bradyrhizobium sp.]
MSWAMMPGPGVKAYAAAPSGPTYIGSTGTGGYGGATVSSITIPAGAAAGDLVLLLMNSNNTSTWTPPAGSTDAIPGGSPYFVLNVRTYASIYTLTSSDITAGTLSFTAGASKTAWSVMGVFVRGATSVNAYNPTNQNSTSYTIPGVTTTATAVLVAMVGAYNYSEGITINAISGYTLGIDQPSTGKAAGRVHAAAYYEVQSSAGASGNVSGTYSPSCASNAILFALA